MTRRAVPPRGEGLERGRSPSVEPSKAAWSARHAGTTCAESPCVRSAGAMSTPGSHASPARALGWAGTGAFAVLWMWLIVRLAPAAAAAPWRTGLALGLAYLAADLVGGLVHWAVDT